MKSKHDLKTKEGRAAYMREWTAAKRQDSGYINHDFDIISDVCLRCGLERHKKAHLKHFGRFIVEYRVKGKWTTERPLCTAKTKLTRQ
jgi:hypothetical protein